MSCQRRDAAVCCLKADTCDMSFGARVWIAGRRLPVCAVAANARQSANTLTGEVTRMLARGKNDGESEAVYAARCCKVHVMYI